MKAQARVRTFLAFLFILVLTASLTPAKATPPSNLDFAAMDAYVEAQMRAARIPGLALGIVQSDHVVHLRDLLIPFIVFIFLPTGAGFPLWKVMGLIQPDLTYWLLAAALVLLGKGLARPVLVFSALKNRRSG